MANSNSFQRRLQELEKSSEFRVLRSANNQTPLVDQRLEQYIVYTDFQFDQRMKKTNSIFVYTPWMNVDSQGRSRTDYQNQLLFDYDGWQHTIHITVLETLGAASRLAFFDYQDRGLARLSLEALLKLARRLNVDTVTASLSSFDGDKDFQRVVDLYKAAGFQVSQADADHGLAKFTFRLR